MDSATFLKELYKTVPKGLAEIRLIYEHRVENSFPTEQQAWEYRKQVLATGTPKHATIERHEDKLKNVTYSVDVAAQKKWRPMPIGEVSQDALERLRPLNAEWHIYHRTGISYQQRSTKADIVMLPAIWLDVDDNSSDAYNQLLSMNFYPNIIVSSGGGFHAYWLLTEPVMADSKDKQFEIERTMEGMILEFGGSVDPKTKDVTRILRTPGFLNIKVKYGDNQPLARVVFEDDARYTFEALHNLYAPMGRPKQAEIKRHIPSDVFSKQYPAWVQKYLQEGRGSGQRNSTLYGAALELRACGFSQGEVESDLIMRAVTDGLEQSEAVKTITSAFKRSSIPTAKNIPSHMASFMAIEDSMGGES
jgi:hypothetical protein